MRLILGIVIGAVLVYLLMGKDTGDLGKSVKDAVHNAASEVARSTETSTADRVGNVIDSLSK